MVVPWGKILRILIVETDRRLATTLDNVITDAGHICIGIARSAPEAVDLAATGSADLALIDTALGDGAAAYELAHELQDRWMIKCLMLGRAPARVRPEPKHFQSLTKPPSEDALLAALETLEREFDLN